MRYPQITFLVRKAFADRREHFSNVIVEGAGFALPEPIVPQRTTARELRDLLGEPPRIVQFADSAAYTYDVPRGPTVQFYFVGDVLRKVRWVYEAG